ncbi:hypothetical protein HMPREF1635_03185 [Clostridiales bacterium S5-A14a]|nr:hypothetical protein HMPREF1635_03185 [Clostridiales bacterium S5-A14a]
MLGLSIKEKLYKLITYFYKIYLDDYIEKVEMIMRNKDELSDSKIEREMKILKKEYDQKVFESSRNYVIEKMPTTRGRIEEAMSNPEIVGLNHGDLKDNVTPGKMLIVLLYGAKKKQPRPKECSALDLVQHEMLRNRLVALDAKLKNEEDGAID